jgi:hypothetical protein
MTEQTQSTSVRVETTVAAPIDHAFAVFTGQCDRWWPPTFRLSDVHGSPVLIEPRTGGRWYEAPAGRPELDWGAVLEWDPPRAVTLSWQITPQFGPEPDPRRASRVEARFTADGPSRTNVALVHSQIERHGDDWEAMREAVANAWPDIMETYAKTATP